jgi:hypothetical protein
LKHQSYLNNFRPKVNLKFTDVRTIAKNRRCYPRDLEHMVSDESIALNVKFRATEYASDARINIWVLVSLRPWPRYLLNAFEIQSEVLDITFKDLLGWEVDNLIMHSTHGDSEYNTSH